MSLFNDGRLTTAEDLCALESSILDVASAEGIELDRKMQVATREIGTRLTEFLLNYGDDPIGARDLSGVMVTDPLREWHVAETMTAIFRDAHGSHLNDRYAAKLKHYAAWAREACRRFLDIGVGISNDPVPAADVPVCGITNGGVLPAADYWVQICWRSGLGRNGAVSDPVVVHVSAGQLLTVKAGKSPSGATGWNLYAGRTAELLMRQNASPIVPGATWIMPVDGLSPGPAPEDEAADQPDLYVTRCRIFRG
jgi:hypothetical protein